ncbi:hypothetical protein Tco_0649503 [Tanacetum coccineum]
MRCLLWIGMRSGVGVDTMYPRYWIWRTGWSKDHARIRHIFLDGYGVLVVRIVIFKMSSFMLQNAFLALGWHLEGIHVTWDHLEKKQTLHQILEEILLIERGDGVAGKKQRRRDPSSNGVRDLVMASGHSRINEDLESST